jgi:hypothetical protein
VVRFAPVHTVAEALIAFLGEQYCVSVVEEASPEGARTVAIVPEEPGAASLLILFSAFPGIIVRVGSLHIPVCACGACDETWQECADELETFVLMGTENGFHGLNVPDKPQEPWRRQCHELHT